MAHKAGRTSNWSLEEISVLSEFVRMHMHQLVGTRNKGSANIEHVKSHYWKLASTVLVENGGEARPWKKIRKKWQNIKSQAKTYYRDCNRTGGGERPTENKMFEVVLQVLAPASKDGIICREEGESYPGPTMSATDPEEEVMDLIANAISQGETLGEDDTETEMTDASTQGEEAAITQKEVGNERACSSFNKPTTTDSIMLLERERLIIERERLQIDKEQLNVFRQISGSLKEISQSFQLLLTFTQQKPSDNNEL